MKSFLITIAMIATFFWLPPSCLGQTELIGNNLSLLSTSPHTDFPNIYFANDGFVTRFEQELGELRYYSDLNSVALRIDCDAAHKAVRIHSGGIAIGQNSGTNNGGGLKLFVNDQTDIPSAKISTFDQHSQTMLRTMLELGNNGPVRFEFHNTDTDQTWAFQTNNADGFLINRLGSGGNEFSIRKSGMVTMGPGGKINFLLDPAGNLQIDGTLSQSSDRDKKESFAEIDGHQILEKVSRLPITSWRYKDDVDGVRHIGPVAQDFYREFQMGKDDKTISTVDADGVALAAIQALTQQLDEKSRRLEDAENRIDRLETMMSDLLNPLETRK